MLIARTALFVLFLVLGILLAGCGAPHSVHSVFEVGASGAKGISLELR